MQLNIGSSRYWWCMGQSMGRVEDAAHRSRRLVLMLAPRGAIGRRRQRGGLRLRRRVLLRAVGGRLGVGALRARGRGRNPFLRIVGLNTAGWGLRRLEMRRGHGDGRDRRVVLGIEGTAQGGGERVKSKSEAGGVARGSHGDGVDRRPARAQDKRGDRHEEPSRPVGRRRREDADCGSGGSDSDSGGSRRTNERTRARVWAGWLGSGPTNQTQTRQPGGAAERTDVSGAGVCQFSDGCACVCVCVCVIASRIESSSPGWSKPLAPPTTDDSCAVASLCRWLQSMAGLGKGAAWDGRGPDGD
jgi:hypothetical protein